MRSILPKITTIGAITVSVVLANPASAEDEQVLTLAPASEWKLREYPDKCRASRVFGEGEERTTLWIDQGGREPSYNVTMIGEPLKNSYGNAVRLQFGDEPESLRSYIRAKSSKGRPVITMYGVALSPPKLDPKTEAEVSEIGSAREQAITELRLSESIRKPIKLETGPMAAPLGFLRGCAEQLGIALARASRSAGGKSKPPRPLGEEMWLTAADYPQYLIRAEMEGRVEFRLTVNEKGRPSDCHVRAADRPQLFDDAVCLGLMKRARFRAALNTEGTPTASYFYSSVRFRMR